MNQTVLTLISALAIYGLSSLTLPRPSAEGQNDALDIQSEETAEASPASLPDGDAPSI